MFRSGLVWQRSHSETIGIQMKTAALRIPTGGRHTQLAIYKDVRNWKFGFKKGVDDVNWPTYRDSKSWRFERQPSSEQIDVLWVVCGLYREDGADDFRPSESKMTMTSSQTDERWLWVRRWLVRPIRTRKARPNVGHALKSTTLIEMAVFNNDFHYLAMRANFIASNFISANIIAYLFLVYSVCFAWYMHKDGVCLSWDHQIC